VIVQVTDVLGELATFAVNTCPLHASSAAVVGLMETAMVGAGGGGGATGGVTVTTADPLLVVSATLVATTVQVAPAFGAVYTPAAETDPQADPPWTVQATEAFVVPVTAASKGVDPPAGIVAVPGLTVTVTDCAAFETCTTLLPALLLDAPVVGEAAAVAWEPCSAVTWNVPSMAGAV
jgi:hypothetical protein